MRKDKNYMVFAGRTDWWDIVEGAGYVPTESAPKKAVDAMEKYNSYSFPSSWKEKWDAIRKTRS